MTPVRLIECPRDAWQGLATVIPTHDKVAYHRGLLDAGFRRLDAVSFVSPKHVPQMADSEEVAEALARDPRVAGGQVEIIGIVVNERGMERALAAKGVTTLGYPHSVSPEFLKRNANLTTEESLALVGRLLDATTRAGRRLVVYVSMAFGNPYQDPWSPLRVAEEARTLCKMGVRSLSLSDTNGAASTEEIVAVLRAVKPEDGDTEVGIHLHSRVGDAEAKILAAYDAGCRRFDSALTGLGGCPFAGDELVGNIPTEAVLAALQLRGAETGLAAEGVRAALEATRELRARYARA